MITLGPLGYTKAAAAASVVSDSVRPHRRQPTRLPHPWDSPGKNTGVGCHFLLQCMKVKNESQVTQSYPTLSDPMDCSLPGSSVHGFSRQEYWSGVPSPSPYTKAAVPNVSGTRDQFCGRQFSHGQSRGMVSGRFKLITFIAHFSSPLMLLLISHEALVHGPEVGDPW